ncbi:MAG: T9SS type A sorting domain-containing protein [Saprospiraceae bacterium]|nr:T9SS type A sorting domain-containing protein [Candidatus Vicinibacter affinis]
MKNNFYTILLLNLLLLDSSFAQIYTPLNFKNYNPLWTHLYNTEKIPIKSGNWIFLEQNFYRAPAVIEENVLYNVYNIVFGPVWIGGYYLEAIDIKTGKLLWDHVYYSENIGEGRYSNRPLIHGDTLELLIHEEYSKSGTSISPIWIAASARRLSLNKSNGAIIKSTFSIPKDSNARRIPVPFPYGPTHLYHNDTNFIVINHLVLTDTLTGKSSIWYNRIVLDLSNKEIGNTELYVPTKYHKLVDALFNYDNSNTTFCAYTSETHPDSMIQQDFDIGYHYMDRELNILTSGKLNMLKSIDANQNGPSFISEDYFIYLSRFYRENPYLSQIKDIILFDRLGTPIEKIDLRPLEISSVKVSFVQATLLKTSNGPRILFCVHTRTTNKVEFYLSDGGGNFFKTNTFLINPDRKTEISLNKLDLVGDNVLCNFIYRENAANLNEAPLWSSWIMIKGEDIGVSTANKDVSLYKGSILKISPNPVNEKLTIEFDKVISGKLYIYNEIGHLIRSEDLYDVKEYNYNVSELLDGKYHIQFIDDNKIFNAQFIKFK